ncbi:MAG: helix-turn-helix transcriptional regulator [Actinobacteria bacterium]|nr:MAG: helix-turn-helix transcriptional regulator [Actinomycetota bacterium]
MFSNGPTKRGNINEPRLPDHRGRRAQSARPRGSVVTARSSSKPFGEALRLLMDGKGLTYRALADATRKLDGRGLTHAHINMLANGHDRPSMRAMELVAEACGVGPTYFAEYRLAAAMRELDPMEVGLEQALANLNARLGARRRSGAKGRAPATTRAEPRPTG